jgi:hypothetical protein
MPAAQVNAPIDVLDGRGDGVASKVTIRLCPTWLAYRQGQS